MATARGEIPPERRSGNDLFHYLLAVLLGGLAGWTDLRVGDLLLTAMVVLAACMLLGFLRPRQPWRWVVIVGVSVPLVEWTVYHFLSEKPQRGQVYKSLLAFLPGIAGAFGGALGREAVDRLFTEK